MFFGQFGRVFLSCPPLNSRPVGWLWDSPVSLLHSLCPPAPSSINLLHLPQHREGRIIAHKPAAFSDVRKSAVLCLGEPFLIRSELYLKLGYTCRRLSARQPLLTPSRDLICSSQTTCISFPRLTGLQLTLAGELWSLYPVFLAVPTLVTLASGRH